MSQRSEVGDDTTDLGVIGPNAEESLWDDASPSKGRHALVIGDASAMAYAIVGNT